MVVRMISNNRSSALPMVGLPYLMIVQHMAGLRGSPIGLARQFTVVSTQGADTEDGMFKLLFISHWHRQPGVGEDIPLAAPPLPERPDLATQVEAAEVEVAEVVAAHARAAHVGAAHVEVAQVEAVEVDAAEVEVVPAQRSHAV
jgi:hypothetical protein